MPENTRDQTTVRCVLLRGGTSKGLYFHEDDLPPAGTQRDRLLERLMGSPDEVQIDGLGGSRPITSKLAIVSKSKRPDADLDYTFGQVQIGQSGIIYSATCGNISAGVAPFAIDEGIIESHEGHNRVRIYNTNLKSLIVSDVQVVDGKTKVEGEFAISGVPGTGAEIGMNWAGTIGAKTGKLLPTGKPVDKIKLENGKEIDATLCDAANLCVWVRAADMGIEGSELNDALNNNQQFIDLQREVRGKAAVLFGACKDWQKADEESPGIPMIGMVAEPKEYKTINGATVAQKDMDFRLRLMFMNKLHESVAGSGSICLAAASAVKDSVIEKLSAKKSKEQIFAGTPSGVVPVKCKAHPTDKAPFVEFEDLGFNRTARRIMDCNAYYPKSLLKEIEEEEQAEGKHYIGVVHEEPL